MAEPIKVTRAGAVRLIRRIEDDLYPAAAAAGHPGPALRYGDGMTREEARAVRQWAFGIPELRAALIAPGWRDEAQQILRTVTYFEAEHPQTPEGAPADWEEPLSPAMAAFAVRERNDLPVAELLPAELEAMVFYAHQRNDPADFEEARATAVQREVDGLLAAAEAAAAAAPAMFADPAANRAQQEVSMPGIAKPEGTATAPIDPRILLEEIRGMGAIQKNRYLAEKFGPALIERPRDPVNAAAPTAPVAAPPKTGPKVAPVDSAQLRARLQGLNPTQRAARLTEVFGAGTITTATDAMAPALAAAAG